MSDLMSLQVGRRHHHRQGCVRDVLIQVEGRNKFLGQVGQFRGSKSVRITRVCSEPPSGQAGDAA